MIETLLSLAACAFAFARAVCGAITSGRGDRLGSENDGSSVGAGEEEVEGGNGYEKRGSGGGAPRPAMCSEEEE